jgi:hypothetical protein
MVVGQQIALGRIHQHRTVTVLISETTLTFQLGDGDTRVIAAPPPSRCVASKASVRGPLPQFPRPCVAHQLADMCRASVVGSQELGKRRLDMCRRPVRLRLMCDTVAPLDL